MKKGSKKRGGKRVQAVYDMADALRDVFKSYSIPIRKAAWKSLTSKRGKSEINKLIRTPNRSLNNFRTLWSENFKTWLEGQKISSDMDFHYQGMDVHTIYDDSEEAANVYFGIGHGDWDEDYIVWALIGNQIQASPVYSKDEDEDYYSDSGTHGTLWGHGETNRTYKGRYEPETGRVSMTTPLGQNWIDTDQLEKVLDMIKAKFRHVTDVYVV